MLILQLVIMDKQYLSCLYVFLFFFRYSLLFFLCFRHIYIYFFFWIIVNFFDTAKFYLFRSVSSVLSVFLFWDIKRSNVEYKCRSYNRYPSSFIIIFSPRFFYLLACYFIPFVCHKLMLVNDN